MSHSHERLIDLRTGQDFSPPGYEGPEYVYVIGHRRESGQEGLYPSPDGRWLLYREEYLGKPDRDYAHGKQGVDFPVPGQEPERLRLVDLRDSSQRVIPANERFDLPTIDHVAWLPDSSGWLALRAAPFTATCYRRDRLNAPEELRTLKDLPYSSFQSRTHFIAQVTTRGELVIDDGVDGLYFAPLAGGKIRFKRLASPPGVVKEDSEARIACLTPDGRWLMVCARETRRGRPVWVFWGLTTDGTHRKRLLTRPHSVDDFWLSPDGQQMLFWFHGQSNGSTHICRAYLATVN